MGQILEGHGAGHGVRIGVVVRENDERTGPLEPRSSSAATARERWCAGGRFGAARQRCASARLRPMPTHAGVAGAGSDNAWALSSRTMRSLCCRTGGRRVIPAVSSSIDSTSAPGAPHCCRRRAQITPTARVPGGRRRRERYRRRRRAQASASKPAGAPELRVHGRSVARPPRGRGAQRPLHRRHRSTRQSAAPIRRTLTPSATRPRTPVGVARCSTARLVHVCLHVTNVLGDRRRASRSSSTPTPSASPARACRSAIAGAAGSGREHHGGGAGRRIRRASVRARSRVRPSPISTPSRRRPAR
jgi:hypothetical protein